MNFSCLKNMSPIPFLVLLVVTLPALPASAMPTTLDLAPAFSYTSAAGPVVSLPAVTTASDPQLITAKFQGLIRYFFEQGITGE